MGRLDELPWRDIGPGVAACEFRYEPEGQPEGSGRDWRLDQLDPLTISPSLLCMSCQHHGFIRGGVWVSA
jgi:hypothetical protein